MTNECYIDLYCSTRTLWFYYYLSFTWIIKMCCAWCLHSLHRWVFRSVLMFSHSQHAAETWYCEYSFHTHIGDLRVYLSLVLLNSFLEIQYYFLQNSTNLYFNIWHEGCENLTGVATVTKGEWGRRAFRFCVVD